MLSVRRRGFTLIELMIALVLGATILSGGIALLISTLGFNRDLLQTMRSQQDLRLLLDLGLRDLARAGAWRVAGTVASISQTHDLLLAARTGSFTLTAVKAGSNTVAPVFSAPLDNAALAGRSLIFSLRNAAGGIEVHSLSVSARHSSSQLLVDAGAASLPVDRIAAGSWTLRNPMAGMAAQAGCVVFAYDEDGDGQRGAQERFGYRYDAKAQALEGSNNAERCDLGSWQNISDERVLRVSRLNVEVATKSLESSNALHLQNRSVALYFSATPRAGDAAELDLHAAVQLRNDALE